MKKSSELFSISCQKFLLDTKFWNFFYHFEFIPTTENPNFVN